MLTLCARYAPTLCGNPFGVKAMVSQCAQGVPTARPLFANIVAHNVTYENDGPALSSRCAQYVPTMCSLCVETRPGGSDSPARHPLCVHYAPIMCPLCRETDPGAKSIGPQCAPYVPTMHFTMCPLHSDHLRMQPLHPERVHYVTAMRPLCV